MSQRESGYERIDRDLYETPEWATLAIAPYIGGRGCIWEPAAGGGKMVNALRKTGAVVVATDISVENMNFLECGSTDADAIVTNPPYVLATEFVEHALKLMEPVRGLVAMLLRTDFDHAKTRRHLFHDRPSFARKVVLTKRIVWFDRPGAAPSFNHAWYLWDWQNTSPPVLSYNFQ